MWIKVDNVTARHKAGYVCDVIGGIEADAKASSLVGLRALDRVADARDGLEVCRAEGGIVVGKEGWALQGCHAVIDERACRQHSCQRSATNMLSGKAVP